MNSLAEQLAATAAATMLARDAAAKTLGLNLLLIAPGAATFEMPVRDDMTNALGLCHGGFVFALAEAAFLYACNSHNRRAVSQHAAISHIAPAQTGDVLQAQAQKTAHTGHIGFYAVNVKNQNGLLIAEFHGQARIVRGAWIQAFAP